MSAIRGLINRARAMGNRYVSRGHRIQRLIDEADQAASSRDRYEKQFHALQQLATEWGFEIYNCNLAWLNDEEFSCTMNRFPLGGQRRDRKFLLWSLAKSVRDLSGHTAECGVLHGLSSHLICSVNERHEACCHHIFDSFEGLSHPSSDDRPATETAFVWNQGDLSVGLDDVRKNLSTFEFVKYYEGWIPTRFDEVRDLRFKFVHVDVDLYQPTRNAIEFFYPRIVTGGVLLCDDFGYETCPGARKAFDEVASQFNFSIVHLPTGQGFVIKR